MNHRHASRFAAVAALLVLQACGGSGGGDSTDDGGGGYSGTGPGSAALFCEAFADTFAQRYIDCEKAAPAWVTEFIQKSEICGRINYAVDNGLATYDDAAAGDCIAFFETATCTEIRGFRDDVVFVPACQDAVKGKGALNTQCKSDYDCASSRCETYWASPPKCYPAYEAGRSCSTDRYCAPGLYCYKGTLWPNRTCQPFSNRPGLDQACNEGTGCQVGLQCEGSLDVVFDGTCKPQKTEGSCVKEPGLTAIGYGCLGSYGSSTVQPYVGPGATCTAPDNCGPGLYCGEGGICRQEPLVGEACDFSNINRVCIGGTCPQVLNATCQEESIPSECYSDWDCDSYGYCETGYGCQSFPL